MSFQFPSPAEIQYKLNHGESENDFSKRHVVHQYEVGGQDIILKFVTEEKARTHIQNTALFRFFDIPFVPCDMMKVTAGTSQKPYAQKGYPVNDYAVVMPCLVGDELEDVTNMKILEPAYKQLMTLVPNTLIPVCRDVYPRNIIMNENGRNITMIDAEISVLNYMNDKPDKLFWQMVHEYTSMYKDARIPDKHHISSIQKNIKETSSRFTEKLENGLPVELENIDGLYDKLHEHVRFLPKVNVAKCFIG